MRMEIEKEKAHIVSEEFDEALFEILREIRRTEDEDAIGVCGIDYIGNIYMNLYAAGGDE